MTEELITNIVEIQRKLTSLIGVSGREDLVRDFIYSAMKNFADKVWIDPMGNVLAEKNGSKENGLRIMLDAHMDEVGFMIRYIDEMGFLRFSPLGGIDKRLYPGSRVLIKTTDNKSVSGIIGMPPPHITSVAEREKSPDHFGLFIDIGAKNKDEVESLGIDIGSTGVLDYPFEYIPERGIMRGRGFDDRTGCNVLLQIAKLLSQQAQLENTIVFSFSTTEEVGARGTQAATHNLNPDIGFAIENTIAADVPGVPADKNPTSCGSGPAFTAADHGTIYDHRLLKLLQETAKELNIPWQYKLPTFGGTNAGVFHKMIGGIPAAGVSVPCRYIHSPLAQNLVADVQKTIEVLLATISKPIELKY
ncbi:M42 family metallopeptidase [Candidatus Lokiarchaeum ossiferum]|uniref:M42 family metallopeptidase n=1 Tax=Candidatus Lokiarchaeum ossiferum TaxID=2951803 RepID=UPI00352CA0EF